MIRSASSLIVALTLAASPALAQPQPPAPGPAPAPDAPSAPPEGYPPQPADAPPPAAYAPPAEPQPVYVPMGPAVARPFHDGFYIGFSLGAGGLQFTDAQGNESERENSAALTLLRLGGAISDNLLLGANLGGWSKTFEEEDGFDTTVTLVRMNFEATFYPILNPDAVDVYLRGGLGVSRLTLDIEGFGEADEDGTDVTAGVGLERRLGERFAMGLGFDWHYSRLTDDVAANYWEAALLFNWY
jgi:hypothetical protein